MLHFPLLLFLGRKSDPLSAATRDDAEESILESAEKDDVNAAPVVGALVLKDEKCKRMDMTQRNTRGFGGTVGLVMALVVVGDGGTATMTHDLDTLAPSMWHVAQYRKRGGVIPQSIPSSEYHIKITATV